MSRRDDRPPRKINHRIHIYDIYVGLTLKKKKRMMLSEVMTQSLSYWQQSWRKGEGYKQEDVI